MNLKKYIWASIAVFITIQITDPIIHGAILGKLYKEYDHLWRSDMMSKMWMMMLASFVFSFIYVYIFSKVHNRKGILEGVNFGVMSGIFVHIYSIINQYVVYPIPSVIVIRWCVFGIIQYIIMGIVAALIYMPGKDKEN